MEGSRTGAVLLEVVAKEAASIVAAPGLVMLRPVFVLTKANALANFASVLCSAESVLICVRVLVVVGTVSVKVTF